MGILQACGIALLAAISVLCIRELCGRMALPVRLSGNVLLITGCLLLYVPIVGRLQSLLGMGEAAAYITPLLRATGIALICELTAAFCRDLGENTLAGGVLLFGKLEILVLCLPLIDEVLEIAKELLQF